MPSERSERVLISSFLALRSKARRHEKSQPVKVGFFASGTVVRSGVSKYYFARRRSLMRADLPVRSRK